MAPPPANAPAAPRAPPPPGARACMPPPADKPGAARSAPPARASSSSASRSQRRASVSDHSRTLRSSALQDSIASATRSPRSGVHVKPPSRAAFARCSSEAATLAYPGGPPRRAAPRIVRAMPTSSTRSGAAAPVISSASRSRFSPASRAKYSRRPTGGFIGPRRVAALALGYPLSAHSPSGGRSRAAEEYGAVEKRSTRAARRIHQPAHGAHRFDHPGEHRAAHDAVADVELLDFRDSCDRLHVLVGEPVAGVHRQAELPRVSGDMRDLLERGGPRAPGPRIATGAQIHAGHAERTGRIHRSGLGVDEQRTPDSRAGELLDGLHDPRVPAREVEPALGGHFLPALGHQGGLVGPEPADERHRSEEHTS